VEQQVLRSVERGERHRLHQRNSTTPSRRAILRAGFSAARGR
jgi:hypothetical protein